MNSQKTLIKAYIQDINLFYTHSQIALCALYYNAPNDVEAYAVKHGLLKMCEDFHVGDIKIGDKSVLGEISQTLQNLFVKEVRDDSSDSSS